MVSAESLGGEPRRQVARRLVAAVLLGAAPLAASPPAKAEVTRQDLLIVARALGFMDRPLTGMADLGIAYPGGSVAGIAEAQRIAEQFGSDGLRAGSLLLRPRLVPAEEAARTAVAVLLLTEASRPQAGQIAAALAGRGIVIVSTDVGLVERGDVVMAVRSTPRVEIVVSRVAAQRAGVGFSAAFRMMIQER